MVVRETIFLAEDLGGARGESLGVVVVVSVVVGVPQHPGRSGRFSKQVECVLAVSFVPGAGQKESQLQSSAYEVTYLSWRERYCSSGW